MKHKLIILDEADSITPKAQNLLNNIITEFRNNTRFILVCNDCTQITESIQSQCIIIKFPDICIKKIRKKIYYICEKENIIFTEKGIDTLFFVSNNDIRQIINNLECIFYSYGEITEETVYFFTDKPKPFYINSILTNCLNDNLKESIEILTYLYNKGYSPNDILLTFMKFLLDGKFKINEETKLKIYEIISLSYICVNDGIDTLLQLCGCISKINLYIKQ